MSTNADKYVEIMRGMLGAHDAGAGSSTFDAKECVLRTMRTVATWHKHAQDAAAATATGETPFYRCYTAQRVLRCDILPTAALTANDTNYASILLKSEDGAGAGAETISTLTTKITGGSGDWTAKVTVPFTLTAANVDLSAGDILMVQITKAGSGVQLDIFHLVVVLEEMA